jgi:hypothetical protein
MRTPTITSISQGGNYISQLGKQEGTNRESAFPEASLKMSLSRSAVRDDALGLTQSGVSWAVGRMEQRFGLALLHAAPEAFPSDGRRSTNVCFPSDIATARCRRQRPLGGQTV